MSARARRDDPLVSVVLCAWNPQPVWLSAAVASVLNDDHRRLELIVVDDGSTGPVERLLADVDDRRLTVIRIEHGGLPRARNAGLEAARGDFVRFADADDVFERGGFRALLQVADTGTIGYGATLVCDEALSPLALKGSTLQGRIDEQCLLYRFDVMHMSMLFPAGVVEKVGPFDLELRQCQDWDFVLRACEVAPVRGTETVVTRYRRHARSASADVAAALDFEAKVVDRYFRRHPEKKGTSLEREARAKLLMVRVAAGHMTGRGRFAQLRLVCRAMTLDRRRATEEARQIVRTRASELGRGLLKRARSRRVH